MFSCHPRGAPAALALLTIAFAAGPALAWEEINSFDQPRVTDETGRITVEASIVHVVACSSAGENGGQFYIFEYLDRVGFRAIAPPEWGTPIGGRDFLTFDEAARAACGVAEEPIVEEPVVESLGCFRDARERDLAATLTTSPTNTPAECVATCAADGYAYAGVQAGSQCLCGDRFGTYGPADNCDRPCSGDPSLTCGGNWANEVFPTGIDTAVGPGSGSTPDAGSGTTPGTAPDDARPEAPPE